MVENLDTIKLAIVTFLGAVGAFLGWRIIMVLVWVGLMCLDYLSGTWAARLNGTWKSNMARAGIAHKGGMILVVGVCVIADIVMLLISENLTFDVLPFSWPVILFPVVTMWYILTEIGSIIENAIKLGAPIPAWLPQILDATLNIVDTAGETAIPDAVEGEDKC